MIREFSPSDRQALEGIHEASGFDYQFPDLNDPLFVVKKVSDEKRGASWHRRENRSDRISLGGRAPWNSAR